MTERPARVILVEDEPTVRDAVVRALRAEGLWVVGFADFTDPDIVLRESPDLDVLDVMLPGGDRFDLARQVRAQRDLPTIFLTARDAVEDRLASFGLGADDYLVKPFSLDELLARVRVMLRRSGRIGVPLEAGDTVLDESTGRAVRAGEDLGLAPIELRLLVFFIRHRGAVLSKAQLLTQVWGYGSDDENLVEVYVSALRRKLEIHGPRIIHTVRGLG